MRHRSGEQEERGEDGLYVDMESESKGRSIHRDLSTAQEREEYGKVSE